MPYALEVVGDDLLQRLEAILPLRGQLLQEKAEATRARKLTDMVEFMTAQMVVPSVVDIRSLPGSARPVDLLHTAPDSVVEVALRDAQGPAT